MTRFLGATKVKTDIWMFYGRTGSGLNNYLWSSSFVLNTIYLILRGVGLESYLGDNYLGELFLNFPLPVSLCPYCGVYFTIFYPSNLSDHRER